MSMADPSMGCPPQDELECQICFETLGNGSRVDALRCGHCFHARCLQDWRKRWPRETRTACPVRCDFTRRDAEDWIQDTEPAVMKLLGKRQRADGTSQQAMLESQAAGASSGIFMAVAAAAAGAAAPLPVFPPPLPAHRAMPPPRGPAHTTMPPPGRPADGAMPPPGGQPPALLSAQVEELRAKQVEIHRGIAELETEKRRVDEQMATLQAKRVEADANLALLRQRCQRYDAALAATDDALAKMERAEFMLKSL